MVSFLDACDAALDPVYLFFEAGLATWHQSNTGSFFFVALVALPAGSKKKQAKQVADSTCRGTGRVRDTGLKRRYGYGCCNHDENSVQAIYGSHPYTQTSASLESCKGKHFTTKDL